MLVCGTGTGVGKTWVADNLLRGLRRAGRVVSARKPVQSFEAGDLTDAHVLGAATGEPPEVVCPPHRWYEVPMAPPMAADFLGRPPFGVDDLLRELAFPDGVHTAVVETVGGVRSPMAGDGDAVDLASRIRPDLVVLVGDAGLGTINAVRLSASALEAWRVLVVLNRFDGAADLHRRNLAWLVDHDGLAVVTGPDAVVDVLELDAGS